MAEVKLYKLQVTGQELDERLNLVNANFEEIQRNFNEDAEFKAQVESNYAKKTDLTSYALKSELPNTSYFITEHQSLAGYATTDYVDNKVADVVGAAPETLDTLKEIADALNDNATMTMVSDAIATKANAADVYTKNEIDNKGFITELPEIPTVPTNVSAFENDANYLTEHQPLTDYATKDYVDNKVAEVSTGGEINLDAYVTKTELQEASYITSNDIPEIPTVPTNVSAFENDANYLTLATLPAIPSIDGLATETYVSEKIAEVVGGAPETLDTLNEIATALNDNATMTMVSEAIETKANSADVYTKAEIDAAGYLTQAYTDTLYQPKGEYLTEHQSLAGYATTDYVDNKVAEVSTGGEINLDAYVTKDELNAASYLTSENLPQPQDLSEYLTIAYAAEMYQPKGEYLTLATLPAIPSIDGLATETYVSEKIAEVVGGAPETLDTLNEIATALNDNATVTMVSEAISTKANSADVYTKTEIDNKGYLTEHQDLSNYVTSQTLDAKLGDFVTEGSEEHWTMNGVDYEEDPTYEVSNSFDYIHDAESWQQSYENGGLALYYANNPFEDLWSDDLERVANITDHIYTCVDMVAVNENKYDEHTSKYQVLVNNPWNDSINYIKIKCIEFDGETQSTTFGVVGNEYYIEKTATPGDTLYQLYLDESLETPVNANTEQDPYYCYVKITSETVPGFTQSWEGAINAPGAMYPWIVPHFENDETDVNSKIIFRYEGLDDVYPWGDKVFGNGNDHKIWGCASIPNKLGNEFLLTNGETSFDINKFQMVLEHQGVTHYPAVENKEYTVKEYIDMKFQQLFEMINA